MKRLRSIIAIVLALAVCTVLLTGCVSETRVAAPPQGSSTSNTDTTNTNKANTSTSEDTSKTNDASTATETTDKTVVDNKKTDETTNKNGDKTSRIGDDWEVIVSYDADGLVTKVTAHNDDTFQSESYSGYEGKDYNIVVDELVVAIKDAGYYVDDIDRERSHVTIEVSDRYDRDDRYDDRYDWD